MTSTACFWGVEKRATWWRLGAIVESLHFYPSLPKWCEILEDSTRRNSFLHMKNITSSSELFINQLVVKHGSKSVILTSGKQLSLAHKQLRTKMLRRAHGRAFHSSILVADILHSYKGVVSSLWMSESFKERNMITMHNMVFTRDFVTQ